MATECVYLLVVPSRARRTSLLYAFGRRRQLDRDSGRGREIYIYIYMCVRRREERRGRRERERERSEDADGGRCFLLTRSPCIVVLADVKRVRACASLPRARWPRTNDCAHSPPLQLFIVGTDKNARTPPAEKIHVELAEGPNARDTFCPISVYLFLHESEATIADTRGFENLYIGVRLILLGIKCESEWR